jgi:Alpha/beta hydrolase
MLHSRASARFLAVVGLTAAIGLATTAGAFASTPSPPPPKLPAITSQTVELRYEANRDYIADAARAAVGAGDSGRAETLEGMADGDRQFIAFDGRGNGRAVEVVGDLSTARRIAVVVPGADTSIDTFDSTAGLAESARNLYEGIRAAGDDGSVVVVAWLGYAAPDTMSLAALTTGRADDGARDLRRFVTTLQGINSAEVALFCHSYGSVVCGRAAPGLPVSDIVVYGSPGMGADSSAALETEAQIWAAKSSGDWIGMVPNGSLSVFETTIGFGPDPTDPTFGSSTLSAGDGGHGDYLMGDTPLVDDFALIAWGRGGEVARA